MFHQNLEMPRPSFDLGFSHSLVDVSDSTIQCLPKQHQMRSSGVAIRGRRTASKAPKNRRIQQKKAGVDSETATLNLGFSCVPDQFDVINVSASPLATIDRCKSINTNIIIQGEVVPIGESIPSFLLGTRSDDEEKSTARLANNRWFQNQFNKWLVSEKTPIVS